jgi:hypothetical protein
MKKAILLISAVILMTSVCSAVYVQEDVGLNWSVLQPYSTAAFTLSCSSGTGYFRVFESTAILWREAGTYTPSTTTIYLDNSGCSTIDVLISSITGLRYWTATLSEGCYYKNITTTTATGRSDNEGLSDGLAYDDDGKTYNTSTNPIVYLQSTKYIAYYKDKKVDSQHMIGYLEGNPTYATGSTYFNVYEGDSSTTTTTMQMIPDLISESASKASKSYLYDYKLTAPVNHVQSYWIESSTYITAGYLGILGKTIHK